MQAWIATLSSDKIEERSQAAAKLLSSGDTAIPLLTKALSHPDLELRSRCRDILAQIRAPKWKVERGARELAGVGRDVPSMQPEAGLKVEFDALLSAGKVSEILERDYVWLTYAIDGMLSDNGAVVEGSLLVLHQILKKRGLPLDQTDLVSTPDVKVFGSAEIRAAEYSYWAQWWFTKSARDAVVEWQDSSSPERINDWEEVLRVFGDGKGLKDPTSPASRLLRTIKVTGEKACPILIRFIDDDDLKQGAAALRILEDVSGRKAEELTEKNKAQLRKDWEAWLKTQKRLR